MAKYTLRLLSTDNGHEITRGYAYLWAANKAYQQALLSEPHLVLLGIFDVDGNRILSAIEQTLELEKAERERKALVEGERDRQRQAELAADPVERLIQGGMKWVLIGLGALFLFSLFW